MVIGRLSWRPRSADGLFEPEDVDAALARFAELRPDPLRIPPNAATRANDRWWDCIQRQDWEALRSLCAPIVWEDRRRLIRTPETATWPSRAPSSQLRWRRSPRCSPPRATVVLQHLLWTARDGRALSTADARSSKWTARAASSQPSTSTPTTAAPPAEVLERWARSDAARGIGWGLRSLRAVTRTTSEGFVPCYPTTSLS
jgi:hypothetical protein